MRNPMQTEPASDQRTTPQPRRPTRDPLQTEPTPFDILAVSPDADQAEIDKALMAGLRRRKFRPNELQWARDTLLDPMRRARVGLTQYRPELLAQLAPAAAQADTLPGLERARRAEIAIEWEACLERDFPNLAFTHCLAVFWYWWTLHEEERFFALLAAAGPHLADSALPTRRDLFRTACRAAGRSCDPSRPAACPHADCPWRQDCLAKAPDLEEMWQHVFAYWASILAAQDFWTGTLKLDEGSAQSLQASFEKEIGDRLIDVAQRYQRPSAGGQDVPSNLVDDLVVKPYRALVPEFAAELRTARIMAEIKLRLQNGRPITSGRLLLDRMGVLPKVRHKVKEALEERRDDKYLKALEHALSPFMHVTELLAAGKAAGALAAIDQLSEADQQSQEVQKLKARALQERATQSASVGELLAALRDWEQARHLPHTRKVDGNICKDVPAACMDGANTLAAQNQNDEAIALLSKGLKVVRDANMEARLAALLVARAIQAANAVVAKLNAAEEPTQEDLAELSRSCADLQKAVKLGSIDAARHLESLKQVLEQTRSGLLLPPEVREAIANQNWNKAIRLLEAACQEAGDNPPEELTQALAAALANRGIASANNAVSEQKKAQQESLRIAQQYAAGNTFFALCAACHRPATSILNIGGFGFSLCQTHVRELQATQRRAAELVGAWLNAAYKDLRAAARLNPSDQRIRDNLRAVQDGLKTACGGSRIQLEVKEAMKTAMTSTVQTEVGRLILLGVGSGLALIAVIIAVALIAR